MFPSRRASILGGGAGLQNNYSLEFDGTDDYVDCGSNPFSSIASTDYTVSAWVNFPTLSGKTFDRILAGQVDSNNAIQLLYTTDGHSCAFQVLDAGTIRVKKLTSEPNTGTWIHLVGTWDSSADTVAIYRNGIIEDGTYSGSEIGSGSTSGFNIGRRPDGTGPINANIDEVSIWNTALSAGSISNIYNNGVPTDLLADSNSSNLQGWWRFEEGSGTSATDSSTNSNTGTLTNGPTYSTDVPS